MITLSYQRKINRFTWVCCVIAGKHHREQSLAKLISLEKHSGGITGYPIYLLKNDLVNIVILTSYSLLTGANRTTGCRF